MKKFVVMITAAALAASLMACGQSGSAPQTGDEGTPSVSEPAETGSVTIEHELGTTEVNVNPEKIVSFDIGVLDILSTFNIAVDGFPQSTLPGYLSHLITDDVFSPGNMKEADFEAINEYSPELIIISGRMSSAYEELSAIAPTVYLPTPGVTYMETLRENLAVLSEIFPDKAGEFAAEFEILEDAAAALKSEAEASELTALIIMANDGSLSYFGADSRYGIIHSDFGFASVADNIEDSTHGQEGSFEYLAEVNPDIIFVIDRSAAIGTEGATGAQALLDNDLVNATTAAQNDKIIYLSSDIWYLANGGFTATNQMIAEVATALN